MGLLRTIRGGAYNEIDLLSIDIDGNDIYIWEKISVINPRVVIIEYNGKFPSDLEWQQAYNSLHIWNGSDWHGASLKTLENFGRKKGYKLVGTNISGCNAFFVRNDLVKDLFFTPATAEMLYNPLRLGLQFVANHPAKYCLVAQKENRGILNYYDYELIEGFHEEETANGIQHVWTSATNSILRLLITMETDYVEIPYSLPVEVLNKSLYYEVIIYHNNCEKLRQKISETVGSFYIPIDSVLLENQILELCLKTPFTWRPCDLMGASDQRELGIDIILSKISK